MLEYCITNKGCFMTATVRLDESLEKKLELLTNVLHKKKSDVIRDAIEYYAKNIQNSQKRRILNAVEKTALADKNEADTLDGTLNEDSDILIAQIRSIDNDRFIEKLASLTKNEMKSIKLLLDEILN